MKIANKVFIITGGASGLGAASAKRIVAAGGKVVMADLNKEAGEALAKELGANAAFSMTNVADEASAQACIDFAVSHFGGLHGLINCAGVGPAEKVRFQRPVLGSEEWVCVADSPIAAGERVKVIAVEGSFHAWQGGFAFRSFGNDG